MYIVIIFLIFDKWFADGRIACKDANCAVFREAECPGERAKHSLCIWDVMSMSSERLLNIIKFSTVWRNSSSFGGDFWQLKPISSPLDPGIPIFESELFNDVFPHRFELTKILNNKKPNIV